jgi:SAM-dependent methyltransferase
MFADVATGWEQAARRPTAQAMRAIDAGSTPENFRFRGESFAVQAMEALPPDEYPTIVELGAGAGRVTRWLAGYKRIYAVDIAPAMVSWLTRLCGDGTLDPEIVMPVLGNGTNVDHIVPVDGVYTSLVLMHNTRPAVHAIFEGFHRVLRAGGRVAFQLPVYETPVEASRWNQVAQWTETEVLDLAAATGFDPVVVHSNPGNYVKGRRETIGAHHWDLHIFDKEQ